MTNPVHNIKQKIDTLFFSSVRIPFVFACAVTLLLPGCLGPNLNDGRVLSVLVNNVVDSEFVMVGTDGGGLNYAEQIGEQNLLPRAWNYVNHETTPSFENDHVRLMFLAPVDQSRDDAYVLYIATYYGVSYATLTEDGFGTWKTVNQEIFLNRPQDRIRSIHVAYDASQKIESATIVIGSDGGLWMAGLNKNGDPGKWNLVDLGIQSFSSVYMTGNQDGDILVAGSTDNGVAVGLKMGNKFHWKAYSTKDGLPSNKSWSVYITGNKVGDIILLGTNGGGIGWALIQSIEGTDVTLTPWRHVDSSIPGFADNRNAQVFVDGNKTGSTAWIATRAGLSYAQFDNHYDLKNWKTALVPSTTNDIGSVLVKDSVVYLGIYRSGIAAARLEKGKIVGPWDIVTGPGPD